MQGRIYNEEGLNEITKICMENSGSLTTEAVGKQRKCEEQKYEVLLLSTRISSENISGRATQKMFRGGAKRNAFEINCN